MALSPGPSTRGLWLALFAGGLGFVTGAIPGCLTQALVLRVIAAREGVGAAPSVAIEAAAPRIAAPASAVAAPVPVIDDEPALTPDASNPAAPRIASG